MKAMRRLALFLSRLRERKGPAKREGEGGLPVRVDVPSPRPSPASGRGRVAAAAVAVSLFAAGPAFAKTVAVLQGLDKTTARVSKIEAPIDEPVKFGTLTITVRACEKKPPEEPPESAAFLQIYDQRPGTSLPVRLFSGWMFASSPALSALEHPVYDVGVLDCKTDSTSASGSSRPK
jgi:hypothetical protein